MPISAELLRKRLFLEKLRSARGGTIVEPKRAPVEPARPIEPYPAPTRPVPEREPGHKPDPLKPPRPAREPRPKS